MDTAGDVIAFRRPLFVIVCSLILVIGLCVLAWATLFAALRLEGVVGGSARAKRTATVVCVGDVMLDRYVWKKVQANGADSIFAHVLDDLRAGDLVFANLECPLGDDGPHAPNACIFRAPTKAVEVLETVPLDVVSLANNHAYDAGRKGLETTMDTLDEAGIEYVGASRNAEEDPPPVFFEVDGVKIGFLGYTALSFSHRCDAKVDDLDALQEQIASAKQDADLLLVSYHWGDEYRRAPTRWQKQIGHASIDAGADVVLGHHPHVLEGIEAYGNGLILYSMGNFVFDQKPGERMETAIFRVTYVEDRGLQILARPMWIPFKTCAPQPPNDKKRNAILKRLQKMSAELGTTLHISEETALVKVSYSAQAKPGSTAVSLRK